MGGGDGLALRDLLELGPDRAWLVELDPAVIAVSRRSPILDLNRGSLDDPRAKVVVADAKVAIDQFPDGFFDLIVADFPAATTPELGTLYAPEFYEKILRKLSPVGVFASQISESAVFLRLVRQFLERTLGHAFALISQPKRAETQAFVYGSRQSLVVRREAPQGSPIAAIAAKADSALRAGRRVLTYHAAMKPLRVLGTALVTEPL
jgi:spermidine synthase